MTDQTLTHDPFDRPLSTDHPYRRLESGMGIVRVVRVVCDGCGVGVLNMHASGADRSSELVAACRECGSETAWFYDVVLVERSLAERYGWEEAA